MSLNDNDNGECLIKKTNIFHSGVSNYIKYK